MMVAVPGATAVTTPEALTEATLLLLEDHDTVALASEQVAVREQVCDFHKLTASVEERVSVAALTQVTPSPPAALQLPSHVIPSRV